MKVLKTLIRVYVKELDSALAFYENLLGMKAQSRFGYAEMKLELATVGEEDI